MDLPRDYLENSPSSQLISTALAAIAEFETARRRERQRQGIEAAKEKKKYTGRKSVINKDLIKTVEKYKDLGVSVTEISRITGKSRSTIYKVLKEELGYISNRLVKNEIVPEKQKNGLIDRYSADKSCIYLLPLVDKGSDAGIVFLNDI